MCIRDRKWSHNQGLGINFDFWPYNVYSYDAEKDSYSEFAKVDAWNKSVSNTKNGIPFPDNIDVDGDGIEMCIRDRRKQEIIEAIYLVN